MRDTATQIVRTLRDAGFEAYWVGGCVRDFLLGRDPQDYDIATDARPDDVERLFPRTVPVGKQFGVMIVVDGDDQFQVATFRAEANYQDGRRPEQVHFSHAREDAIRRDFTVNGLFFDPITGTVHDWVGGQADLKAKLVRTIGSPDERFAEDHLRLLRAIRFAAQLGFDIDAQTFDAIRKTAPKIERVSAERIRDELIKLFSPPHAARGLDLLRDSGLLPHVLPEFVPTITCDQSPDYHPEGTVYNHVRLMLDQLPNPLPQESLPWATIFHDIAKPETSRPGENGSIHFYGHEKIGAETTETVMSRLRFPRRQIEETSAAVLHHMQFKDVPNMRKATLRRMLLRDTFPLELELHRLDCLGSHRDLEIYNFIREQQAELGKQPELHPPLVNGHDLLALGFKPGREIGHILHQVRDKQLGEELKTRDQALEWAKQEKQRSKGAEEKR